MTAQNIRIHSFIHLFVCLRVFMYIYLHVFASIYTYVYAQVCACRSDTASTHAVTVWVLRYQVKPFAVLYSDFDEVLFLGSFEAIQGGLHVCVYVCARERERERESCDMRLLGQGEMMWL